MRPTIFKLMDKALRERAAFDNWITLSGRDKNGDKHGGARVLLDDDGAIVYGLGGGHEGKKLGEVFAEQKKKQDVRGQGMLFGMRSDKRRDKKEDGGKLEREREALKERGKEQERKREEKSRAEFQRRDAERKAAQRTKSETPEAKAARERAEKRASLDKEMSAAQYWERVYKKNLNEVNGKMRGDEQREKFLKEQMSTAKGTDAERIGGLLKEIQGRRELHERITKELKTIRTDYKRMKKEHDALGYDAARARA